jgi:fumarylpyruvate hydrolase
MAQTAPAAKHRSYVPAPECYKARDWAAAAGEGMSTQLTTIPGQVFAIPVVTLPVVGSSSVFPVRRLYCVGRNYLEHIREFGNDEREPPFFFAKHRDCIVQNGSEVRYPSLTKNYQHELELVVAMKSGGENIAKEDALSHVFGYATGLDMTRRDLQMASRKKEQPWEIGKSFEQSAPCTAITPAEVCGHLSKGKIQLRVNGTLKQDGDLAQMIWNVPEIIAALSLQVGLDAGDLIFTGTPSGVVACNKGDVMVGTVDGLSELKITIV